MYSRAETSASGGSAEGGSEEEGGESGGKYKRRLQAALRELEAVRRQLRQQHEDDLEQLVNLKKQLEKKVKKCYTNTYVIITLTQTVNLRSQI